MDYWLVKSDPETYGWDEMKKDGETFWDGVRNYAARLHLNGMKKGDHVLFYQSQGPKNITGIVEVVKESYQDPTTDDERWVAVDLKVVREFKYFVTLADIKADDRLQNVALVRQSRLSVMPIQPDEWKAILDLEKKGA